jgi:hypothetical protein
VPPKPRNDLGITYPLRAEAPPPRADAVVWTAIRRAEDAWLVVPTLLVVGLLLGRWWRVVLPVATVGWHVSLVLAGIGTGLAFWLSAAAVGLANTAVGVAVNRLVTAAVRRSSRADETTGP